MTTPNQPKELPPPEATAKLQAEGDLPVLPLQFIPITEYTTFRAELAIADGDLIFHFYVTAEVNVRQAPTPLKYWMELFPAVLESMAKTYFNADFPRLKAAYTEEHASWWFRAFGFGHVLDPHKFAYDFLEKLDAALDEAISKTT